MNFCSKVYAKFQVQVAANFTWKGDEGYWYSSFRLADYSYRGEIQLFDGKYEWEVAAASYL